MNWEEYFENLQGSSQYQTGYSSKVLAYLYEKYFASNFKILPKYFYVALVWIKIYTKWRQEVSIAGVKLNGYTIEHYLIPALEIMYAVFDEIKWEDRLDPFNHAVHFPTRVTFMVDTYPVVVLEPVDSLYASCLYSGKYKATVFKFQACFDFLGRLIFFSGPHLGK